MFRGFLWSYMYIVYREVFYLRNYLFICFVKKLMFFWIVVKVVLFFVNLVLKLWVVFLIIYSLVGIWFFCKFVCVYCVNFVLIMIFVVFWMKIVGGKLGFLNRFVGFIWLYLFLVIILLNWMFFLIDVIR